MPTTMNNNIAAVSSPISSGAPSLWASFCKLFQAPRNDRTATAVAPLSPRARDGAPVSMPLNWNQVRAGFDSQRFTMRTASAQLRKSKPWRDYCEGERSLKQAIEKLVRTK